jgi:sugar lactone lactonase YvrE
VKQKSILLLLITAVGAGISCRKPSTEDPAANPLPPNGKKWIVSTLAGDGTPNFFNGPSLSASFHFPEDIVFSLDGPLYVTDVFNRVIRKIAGGQVSTFAGGIGFDVINGHGESAGFKSPYSVTVDANGNLYTTDDNDPRIRKISPDGDVTTFAGIEIPGFADGNADVAQFKPGNYIVADPAGNLYVSDGGNNRIRKITAAGQVTTLAGTGTAGFKDGDGIVAQFNFPGGIALDKNGNLYVADRGNFRIRKITPTGEVSTVAGTGVQGNRDGIANEAQFSLDMRDIIVDDDGNLYLTELDRIRFINSQGVVSVIAGSTSGYLDGVGVVAKFNYPNGLALDAVGNLYVADLNNNRIRKISFE